MNKRKLIALILALVIFFFAGFGSGWGASPEGQTIKLPGSNITITKTVYVSDNKDRDYFLSSADKFLKARDEMIAGKDQYNSLKTSLEAESDRLQANLSQSQVDYTNLFLENARLRQDLANLEGSNNSFADISRMFEGLKTLLRNVDNGSDNLTAANMTASEKAAFRKNFNEWYDSLPKLFK